MVTIERIETYACHPQDNFTTQRKKFLFLVKKDGVVMGTYRRKIDAEELKYDLLNENQSG